MERFGSIKASKNANHIQNLCRLCGMANPGMTEICEDLGQSVIDLDDDPTLQIKIEACIGIYVTPDDKLSQYCCGICTDKICDFYEFRLMCQSTDIQTRRLMGLPSRVERRLVVVKQESKIKQEESLLMEIAPPPDVAESRKQPNKRPAPKTKFLEPVVQLKRIKIEPEEISCSVCSEKFVSEGDKYAHMYTVHVPSYAKYGCSSCGISFNQLDWKQHRSWHMKRKEPFTCVRCFEPFDKFPIFAKHFQTAKCMLPPPVTQPDIQCELCRKRFGTRNLYQWHSCFIKNKTNCRKCGQYFGNKTKLFTHFLTCPLPFIDVASKKPPETPKTKLKKTEPRTNVVKTEDDLDISALLETSLHETSKDEPCPSKISNLLESVNDAIDKISAERKKSKEERKHKKTLKKITPMKLRIKREPEVETSHDDGPEEDQMPPEEHFGDFDDEDDESSQTSHTTTTEASGNVTPALRIKQEKIDAAYEDVREKPKEPETLQDVIRNIKKEPGVHTQEELREVVKSFNAAPKVKKAINPLAMKNKKKTTPTRQQLILKIKKERSETTENGEKTETSKEIPVKKALNPFAAAKKKKNLLKIPAQLALKIKKEKSQAKEKPKNVVIPSIRIKQEKPDSDEEPHNDQTEAPDYFGINPLSILVQKNAQKKKNGVESVAEETSSKQPDEPVATEPEKSPSIPATTPNPLSIFGAQKGGFVKLTMAGLNFGSKSDENQLPVISNVSSGVEEPQNEEKKDEEVVQETAENSQKIDETVPAETSPVVEVKKPEDVPLKPKTGGFMKISGLTSGGFLQFPGIPNLPTEPKLSSNNPASSPEIAENSQKSPEIIPEAPKINAPPLIPGLQNFSSGFMKLSMPESCPKNDVPDTVSSTISTSMDLDDLISSPQSSQIDMESLLNEKLLDEQRNATTSSNCDTEEFLKEIDDQLRAT
ncbi:nucleolar protein dao-5 [Culicoides brevitarsis]|uniref:nucleolar protein dao-5 n=1 Tax=Culicoides brevitarsis TaxID=469753 RepID=UPI00307C753B